MASFTGPEGPTDASISQPENAMSYASKKKLTLGLAELSLLNASLDGLVELRVERGLRRDGDLVVGLHVFLDRLTAATKRVSMLFKSH